MKLELPKPTVNLQEIRQLYHQAAGKNREVKKSKRRRKP
jgi:hypothetical protein